MDFASITLIATGIFLLLFLLFGLCFYCLFQRQKDHWVESINREINRVIPTSYTENDPDEDGQTHWNYGSSSADDLSASSVKKSDKSIQYDYSTFNVPIKSWTTFTSKFPMPNKERLIKTSSGSVISTDDNSENIDYCDYDKITCIHSKETIKETHKHPNILEIKLREETQSIVKEIRKELDRYNQRHILNDDTSSTSEA